MQNSSEQTGHYKRIVRNTVMLYIRMIFLMLISLYTSRLMLQILGIENYGLYNVVAGIIVLFSFLNVALTGATQRFLSFSLGIHNEMHTNNIFCTSVNLHFIIGIVVLVLSETVGLWFFYNALNIPTGRENAALWAYQFAVLTAVLSILRVPYSSLIVSYERMDCFAYFSIIEAILKILPIIILPLFMYDRLIMYSILLTFVNGLILLLFIFYCKRTFVASRYRYIFDKKVFVEMFNYSGWALLGGSANLARGQGVNILFNLFGGVIVNAAMGISNQVNGAVSGFMSNFAMAYTPQIIKYYAEGDYVSFHKLVSVSSKYSFVLMTFITIPIICNIDDILYLWLGSYPMYTTNFCICIFVATLIDAFSAPLWGAIGAVGRMKTYQILMSVIGLMILPYSYVLLSYGFSPVYCIMGNIFVNLGLLLVRVILLKRYSGFSQKQYILKVLVRGLLFFSISFALSKLISPTIPNKFLMVVFSTFISIIINISMCCLIYLSKDERQTFIQYIKKKLLCK